MLINILDTPYKFIPIKAGYFNIFLKGAATIKETGRFKIKLINVKLYKEIEIKTPNFFFGVKPPFSEGIIKYGTFVLEDLSELELSVEYLDDLVLLNKSILFLPIFNPKIVNYENIEIKIEAD